MTLTASDRSAAADRLQQIQTTLRPAAEARRRQTAIEYAATPNGLAEFTRQWELTPPGPQRDRHAQILAAGIAEADDEYLQRLVRDNQGRDDGLLRALLLPSTNDPLTNFLIERRLMGTYRQTDKNSSTATTRVRIHKLTAAGHRTHTYLTYPALLLATNTTITLADVITATAQSAAAGQERLTKLLGDNDYRCLANLL